MDREKWSARQLQLIEALKTMRINCGLTQVELAAQLNRPQSYISKYEKGERRLDLIELSEICKVCGTPLSDFVKVID
ncbi:helix-turn-helix protein [Mariprofundus micogutta]|uniref:Helix-turn-helix protein n=1 Tax=Mariprofundus micogutta TaxID=1921010 RepID=A0A1L8CR77_9PROT|nr:helix-turn-helix transcriptional regulator [Mariprofundus micogutta]GAV21435.1 helix-turn-helix protein [Mariprofundus micogutta]